MLRLERNTSLLQEKFISLVPTTNLSVAPPEYICTRFIWALVTPMIHYNKLQDYFLFCNKLFVLMIMNKKQHNKVRLLIQNGKSNIWRCQDSLPVNGINMSRVFQAYQQVATWQYQHSIFFNCQEDYSSARVATFSVLYKRNCCMYK